MKTAKKISLVGVKDRGVPDKERIALRARLPVTLSSFVVIPTGYNSADEAVFDINYYAFWFPTVDVDAGDTVLIYTNQGENTSFRNGNGHQTYVFHWGFPAPILDDAAIGGIAVLELSGWIFKPLSTSPSAVEEESVPVI